MIQQPDELRPLFALLNELAGRGATLSKAPQAIADLHGAGMLRRSDIRNMQTDYLGNVADLLADIAALGIDATRLREQVMQTISSTQGED